jgi:hypothetical protein
VKSPCDPSGMSLIPPRKITELGSSRPSLARQSSQASPSPYKLKFVQSVLPRNECRGVRACRNSGRGCWPPWLPLVPRSIRCRDHRTHGFPAHRLPARSQTLLMDSLEMGHFQVAKVESTRHANQQSTRASCRRISGTRRYCLFDGQPESMDYTAVPISRLASDRAVSGRSSCATGT